MKKLIYLIIISFTLINNAAFALDRNGNFESIQERDLFLSKTLQDMAKQMNAQAPIMMDESTKFIGALALNKTLNFMYQLIDIDSRNIEKENIEAFYRDRLEVMNNIACKSEPTQRLMDAGITYVYVYSDMNGRAIARVELKNYHC
ncbi:hypothetical protein B0682_00935 [Moraxella lincolnii]|uniref:Uncharacterized protein n=1 Tax=Lwoffella lincolnii TaxID=90241 RepID=A0A1T0CKB8_9GAMM|nr:hypothetical protein [Moraxella lincolnii]OOS22806.1 hypothetical protein B0682_00935 [Moraxella lincolnii]